MAIFSPLNTQIFWLCWPIYTQEFILTQDFFSPSRISFLTEFKKMQESLCWYLVTYHMLSWVSCLKEREAECVCECVRVCVSQQAYKHQNPAMRFFWAILTQLAPNTACAPQAALGRGPNKCKTIFLIHLGDFLKQTLVWKEQIAFS